MHKSRLTRLENHSRLEISISKTIASRARAAISPSHQLSSFPNVPTPPIQFFASSIYTRYYFIWGSRSTTRLSLSLSLSLSPSPTSFPYLESDVRFPQTFIYVTENRAVARARVHTAANEENYCLGNANSSG